MKISQFDKHVVENIEETHIQATEDADQIPEPGNVIRTKKSDMEGKVERVSRNEVYFRLADGRLMKTPLDNTVVVEKLADEDDTVMEDEIDEVSSELLARYKTAAGKDARKSDDSGNFKKGDKRFSGVVKATNKQFANDMKKHTTKEGTMGGISRCAPAQDVSYQDILNDVTDKWKGSTVLVKESGPYKNKLFSLMDGLNEADFNSILQKQHAEDQAAKPKAKVIDIPFHGWTIRYRPGSGGSKTQWLALDRKGDIKHKGEAASDKEAVSAAENQIKSGGGTGATATKNVTLDFNAVFSKIYTPEGEKFYAMFDSDGDTPVMMVTDRSLPGFKSSHFKPGGNSSVSLSAKESNDAKLQPNGRYILGNKEEIDDGVFMYPLILQSITQSVNDKMRMSEPGLTVGFTR